MNFDGIKFDLGESEEILQRTYARIDEAVDYVKEGAKDLNIECPETETGQTRLKDLVYTLVTDNKGLSREDDQAIHLLMTVLIGGLITQTPALGTLLEELGAMMNVAVGIGRVVGREEVRRESE